MRFPQQTSRFLALVAIGAAIGAAVATIGCGLGSGRERFLASYMTEAAPGLGASQAERIASAIVRAERESGVDALLLAAVIEQESRFRPTIRSKGGAIGLMQLRPATAQAVAEQLGQPGDAKRLEDPSANVRLGAAYLAGLHEQLGDWGLALAAYNQGPTRVRAILKRGKRPSTRYSARVLERYEELGRLYRAG